MNLHFYKYQALGNDMVVIDPARFDLPLSPATIRLICDRHFGLGADGVCYGPLPGQGRHHKMRFFNPDGSQAEKSGNGLRIFARYLWDQKYVSSPDFDISIGEEVMQVQVEDEAAQTITITMGRLSFHSQEIPVRGSAREVVEEKMTIAGVNYRVTAASIGNPHCVIFVDEISAVVAQAAGPAIEIDPHFPNRTNVQFVRVVNRHTIEIEIWERGAGYTLASGTSASAAAGAAIKSGRCDSPVAVRMPGGSVRVAIDKRWQVTLTGNVEAVAYGSFAKEMFRF